MTIELSVGGIIRYQSTEFNKDHSEFLLLRNKRGFWGFPQGHKERGENEIQTLQREVQEETGIIDLDIHQYIGKIQYKYFRADGIRSEKEVKFYFATTPVREVVISNEHEGFKWTTYQEALSMLDHRQLKSIILKGRRRGLY
ncbi:MAG TPA: NUDIX domain-containing protein [Candidatus Nitrosocosmicus sp.]|uniref:NUDIX domain-containing protein n=1 Tax=Candidatus Nitrosocosmicus TaxID=1826864 RepID=UPI0011E5DD7E|nr:NUDIX domain-containing protein [Candidatus Nitrosocosmicus hydrocola]GKS60875.1 diadenosine 5'5'''-P1,P4-tetraphosphate pyrophosphohydrolase [Candidatus Nitrosocosmicus sp.]HKR73265.1 NUDIX domain-containing protein [Candidatus Nitrosocosmicus sp.]